MSIEVQSKFIFKAIFFNSKQKRNANELEDMTIR